MRTLQADAICRRGITLVQKYYNSLLCKEDNQNGVKIVTNITNKKQCQLYYEGMLKSLWSNQDKITNNLFMLGHLLFSSPFILKAKEISGVSRPPT